MKRQLNVEKRFFNRENGVSGNWAAALLCLYDILVYDRLCTRKTSRPITT